MPRRSNTPCKHPGCGRLVPYGTMYCDEYTPYINTIGRPPARKDTGAAGGKHGLFTCSPRPFVWDALPKGVMWRQRLWIISFPIRESRNYSGIGTIGRLFVSTCHDSKTMAEDRYEEFHYTEGRSKSLWPAPKKTGAPSNRISFAKKLNFRLGNLSAKVGFPAFSFETI